MTTVEYFDDPKAVMGEAPVWDAASQQIWWVDCSSKKILRRKPDLDAQAEQFSLPDYPGSFALRERGGIIMAYRNGLALVNPEQGESEPVVPTPVDFSEERFNDGACDRAGRFWVGTMDRRRSRPLGALYRVDADLGVNRMAEGFIVSNGIAFSPDDKTMYHHDSRSEVIFARDYDIDRGTIRNQRVFVDFSGRPGRPDGCTVDSAGNLWVAAIGAGCILQFDPRGNEIRAVPLPVSRPSSVMLGGADLSTLFVTSMHESLTPEQASKEPLAGCLFHMKVDVPGLPEPCFSG